MSNTEIVDLVVKFALVVAWIAAVVLPVLPLARKTAQIEKLTVTPDTVTSADREGRTNGVIDDEHARGQSLRRAMSDKIRSYAELRELVRVSLRIQNPEWVKPDGNSPICDLYDERFAALLGLVPSQEDEAELPLGDRVEEAKNNVHGY
jgi:hypothetical protein